MEEDLEGVPDEIEIIYFGKLETNRMFPIVSRWGEEGREEVSVSKERMLPVHFTVYNTHNDYYTQRNPLERRTANRS